MQRTVASLCPQCGAGTDMRTALLLATFVSAALLPGCIACPGRLLRDEEFLHRHQAIRWVYTSGWQTGFVWIVPGIVGNHISGLEATEDGAVVVHEGPNRCNNIALFDPCYRIDLRAGRLESAKPGKNAKASRLQQDADGVCRLSDNVELIGGIDVHMRLKDIPDSPIVRILRLRSQADLQPAYAVRSGNSLVWAASGHVVCVDLKVLQEGLAEAPELDNVTPPAPPLLTNHPRRPRRLHREVGLLAGKQKQPAPL